MFHRVTSGGFLDSVLKLQSAVQATAYQYRGGGGESGLLRLTHPYTEIRKFFSGKKKVYQRVPKLEVEFRTQFFFGL